MWAFLLLDCGKNSIKCFSEGLICSHSENLKTLLIDKRLLAPKKALVHDGFGVCVFDFHWLACLPVCVSECVWCGDVTALL